MINREIIKQDVYEEFVQWFAVSRHEKIKLGIETQGQLRDSWNWVEVATELCGVADGLFARLSE